MPQAACPKCLGQLPELFMDACGWCGGSGQVPGPRTVALDAGEVHLGIRLWHDGEGQGLELHQFLGLSWLEFKTWATYGRLPDHSAWFDLRELRHGMEKRTVRLG